MMGKWTDWILNGLPILLLLGLWIFFMYAMRKRWGWAGCYSKQVELMEQQVALLRETNELLKKLEAKL